VVVVEQHITAEPLEVVGLEGAGQQELVLQRPSIMALAEALILVEEVAEEIQKHHQA
jgi:hypothetical protein